MPKDVQDIVPIVRALVTSHKPPAILDEILREYRDIMGEQLPFRKLGYGSAKDLLADSGEFFFHNYSGVQSISVKVSAKSAHITSMVREQNRGKSKRVVRAPQRAPMRPYNNTGNRYNGGDVRERKPPSDRNNNSSYFQHNAAVMQQPAKTVQPQQFPQRIAPPDYAVNRRCSGPSPKELGEMLNAKMTPAKIGKENYAVNRRCSGPSPKELGEMLNAKMTPAKIGKENYAVNRRCSGPSPKELGEMLNAKMTPAKIGKENTCKQYQQIERKSFPALSLHQPQQLQKQYHNYVPRSKTPSVQNRLKVNNGQSGSAIGQCNGLAAVNKSSMAPSKQMFEPRSFPPTNGQRHELKQYLHQSLQNHMESILRTGEVDPLTQLERYCVQRGYPVPEYTFLRLKMRYGCRVLVNTRIFATYPKEYGSALEARINSAVIAINAITKEEMRQTFPLCTFTDAEIIEALYEMLVKRPRGLYTSTLPDLFASTLSLSLPTHWWSLLTQSDRFIVEKAASSDKKFIVYANSETDATAALGRADDEVGQASGAANVSKSTEIVTSQKPITLPWNEKYWDLLITSCNTTTEVWARLTSNNYNDPFEKLMRDIEEHMKCEDAPTPAVISKQIYLVYIQEIWHRARVEELDKQGKKALCFFIDFGDAEWVSVTKLRICAADFLQLPPQAVPFSLYGLRDFADYPKARPHLDAELTTKNGVIGEIVTKEEDFYANDANKRSHIEVVLYDTSASQDIDLNSKLMQQICTDMIRPELKPAGITNVIITHITDEGELYMCIPNDDLKHVQKLIQDLVNAKFRKDQHRADVHDLKFGILFLICDMKNTTEPTSWHRGVLSATPTSLNITESDIFFIDSGRTERVQHSNLFRLESVSRVLSKLPPQAIKVCLHNIPPVNKVIVGRLRGLLSRNCEAMVKVAMLGDVPMVTVYKRMETVETVCTINDIICIEHELAWENNGDGVASCSSVGRPISSLAEKTELPTLRCYESIPEIDKYFAVRVTMSANPLNFSIHPYKDYPQLQNLMKDLQAHCDLHDETIPADKIEVGQAYAAKNPDGFFHRVIVLNKINEDVFTISYCDFGDIAALGNGQLRTLPLEFRHLPIMAVKAKLHGIEPRLGHWTLDDCLRFRELTVGMKFVSIVKAIAYDGPPKPENQVLELEMIDVSTPEDVLIHEVLLKEERAVKAIESF